MRKDKNRALEVMARDYKPGVILLSGGMDSTTLLYLLQSKGAVAGVLSFDYGQRHRKELEFARWHVERLGLKDVYKVIPLSLEGASALLREDIEVPEGHYKDQTMRITVVPFRNAVMLAYAVNYAEALGASKVYYAAHEGDHAIYPDCRVEFIDAMKKAAEVGTYAHIGIEGPFDRLTKGEIAIIGYELGVDWTKTWSCYKGGEYHCGKCGTCIERREALGDMDPTVYLEG